MQKPKHFLLTMFLMTAVLQSCNGGAEKIQDLEVQIQSLEADLSTAEAKVLSLKSEISSLESDNNTKQNKIRSLEWDLQSCNSKVNNARLGLPF